MTAYSKSVVYKEFKDIFLEMISTFISHEEILKSSERLLENEIKMYFIRIVVTNTKGKLFRHPVCCICKKKIQDSKPRNASNVIYMCDHIAHEICILKHHDGIFECNICKSNSIDSQSTKRKQRKQLLESRQQSQADDIISTSTNPTRGAPSINASMLDSTTSSSASSVMMIEDESAERMMRKMEVFDEMQKSRDLTGVHFKRVYD